MKKLNEVMIYLCVGYIFFSILLLSLNIVTGEHWCSPFGLFINNIILISITMIVHIKSKLFNKKWSKNINRSG